MTWTYDGDPSANDRDWVRFEIQDTDSTDQLLTDEEIAGLITDRGSKEAAAVAAAEALAARFARQVDKAVGDLRLSLSQRSKAYYKLAADLRRKLALRTGKPLAGGLSKSRKETVESDPDRVVPSARKDQFRFPGRPEEDPLVDDC